MFPDKTDTPLYFSNNMYNFGMVMLGRNYASSSGYRYGFNGMEKDVEVKGGY